MVFVVMIPGRAYPLKSAECIRASLSLCRIINIPHTYDDASKCFKRYFVMSTLELTRDIMTHPHIAGSANI